MCEKALGLKIIDSLVVNFVDLENHLSTWEEEIVPEKEWSNFVESDYLLNRVGFSFLSFGLDKKNFEKIV